MSERADPEDGTRLARLAPELVALVVSGVSVEDAAEQVSVPLWEAWAAVIEAGVRQDPRTGGVFVAEDEAHPEATARRVEQRMPRPFPTSRQRLLAGEVEQVVADYAAGMSLKALAEKYGVGAQTVRARLLEAGVAMRPQGRRAARPPQ